MPQTRCYLITGSTSNATLTSGSTGYTSLSGNGFVGDYSRDVGKCLRTCGTAPLRCSLLLSRRSCSRFVRTQSSGTEPILRSLMSLLWSCLHDLACLAFGKDWPFVLRERFVKYSTPDAHIKVVCLLLCKFSGKGRAIRKKGFKDGTHYLSTHTDPSTDFRCDCNGSSFSER